jgi:hypothetical protein
MRLALILTLLFLAPQMTEGTDQPLKEVPASEILDKVKNGLPVEYDHVIVRGNLDLSSLKGLPIRHVDRTEIKENYNGVSDDVKIVVSPIRIYNSIIDGTAYFDNIIFENKCIRRSKFDPPRRSDFDPLGRFTTS